MMQSHGFSARLVKRHRAADWVVLVPGAGATSSIWFRQRRDIGKRFNLVLLELPGHRGGASSPGRTYSFEGLAEDLCRLLRELDCGPVHFMAVSLGTILARLVMMKDPEIVRSAVLVGTVARLTRLPKLLMGAGAVAAPWLPYMALYRIYAWAIMPGPSHRRTRRYFCRDAAHLGAEEFARWFSLRHTVDEVLSRLASHPPPAPVLHVMGQHDYMFLRPASDLATREGSALRVLGGAGHVCSVEAAPSFNQVALDFFQAHGSRAIFRSRGHNAHRSAPATFEQRHHSTAP